MLPVPEVILTYIYSFLTKRDVSRFNVNVSLTKHIREYMLKLNRRLLAHLQVRSTACSCLYSGKVLIHGEYMYTQSHCIIQVLSLSDMKVRCTFRGDHEVHGIGFTESHFYYLDRDPFTRLCRVYQAPLYIPRTELSRVLISEMPAEYIFAYAGCVYVTYRKQIYRLVGTNFVPFLTLPYGGTIVHLDVRTNSSHNSEYMITTQHKVFVYDGTTLAEVACIGKIGLNHGQMFKRGIFLQNKRGFLTNKGLMVVHDNETTFIPNCVSVLQFQDFIICFITNTINANQPRLSGLGFYHGNEYSTVNYPDVEFIHASVFKTPDETAFGFISGSHIRLICLQ